MDEIDAILRPLAAAATGMIIGIDRDVEGKPIGMRTLSLVALGTALVAISALNYPALHQQPDSMGRVIQGVLTGILTGVGFIGAGVVVQPQGSKTVHGLTTAATVWMTAALGIASALGAWPLVAVSVGMTLFVLFVLRWIERATGLKRHADGGESPHADGDQPRRS